MQRIFIKVFGFSDIERHALNTLFRLSESRSVVYALWNPEAPEPPKLAFIEGASWEAAVELAHPSNDELKIVWVGEGQPEGVWRAFSQPVQWRVVIAAMDQEFAPSVPEFDSMPHTLTSAPGELDPLAPVIELETEFEDSTAPAALDDAALGQATERILLVDASRDDRLYMRAKCASLGMHEVDEAATGKEALELLQTNRYRLAVIDLGLRDVNSWKVIQQLGQTYAAPQRLLLTANRLSLRDRVKARIEGAQACMAKPLDSQKLLSLLQNS